MRIMGNVKYWVTHWLSHGHRLTITLSMAPPGHQLTLVAIGPSVDPCGHVIHGPPLSLISHGPAPVIIDPMPLFEETPGHRVMRVWRELTIQPLASLFIHHLSSGHTIPGHQALMIQSY